MLAITAQFDYLGKVRTRDLPDVAEAEPLVGDLDLPAVLDDLIEDAEFVAYAVADGRVADGSQRVEIAGRQSAQSAVSQTGLFFQSDELIEVETQLGHRLTRMLGNSQIKHFLAQMRPH